MGSITKDVDDRLDGFLETIDKPRGEKSAAVREYEESLTLYREGLTSDVDLDAEQAAQAEDRRLDADGNVVIIDKRTHLERYLDFLLDNGSAQSVTLAAAWAEFLDTENGRTFEAYDRRDANRRRWSNRRERCLTRADWVSKYLQATHDSRAPEDPAWIAEVYDSLESAKEGIEALLVMIDRAKRAKRANVRSRHARRYAEIQARQRSRDRK